MLVVFTGITRILSDHIGTASVLVFIVLLEVFVFVLTFFLKLKNGRKEVDEELLPKNETAEEQTPLTFNNVNFSR